MSGLAKLKKDQLKLVAEEIGLTVPEDLKRFELKCLIEESEVFKNDNEFVKIVIDQVLEEIKIQKSDQDCQIELERLKLERVQAELQLMQLKNSGNNIENSSVNGCETENELSIEVLIKSVRTLTVKLPSKAEGWGYFFTSLERAYCSKKVPEKFKAEILLNLLGERASNILTYITEKDLNNYEEIKSIVLREYEPTAEAVLENFRNAYKENETHVQFASRLTTSFDYYLKLRGVTDFENLKQLIVADKLFQTLDKETAAHVNIRQSGNWFKPVELARECDLYFTSRGKVINETKKEQKFYNNKFKTTPKVFFNEVKNKNCDLCFQNMHPLYYCPQFKRLSVQERIEVIKKKNACFKCLSLNCCVRKCAFKNCHCGKAHSRLLHYPRETKNVRSTNEMQSSSDAAEVVNNSPSGGGNAVYGFSVPPNAQVFNQPFVATNVVENKKNVILSTVQCLVKDKYHQWQKVRCLMDVGSQVCLISDECLQRLQLKSEKINQSISCINNASLTATRRVQAIIANKNKTFERNISMLRVQKITDLIPNQVIDAHVQIPESIELADPKFKIPGKIDILISAEYFYDIIKPEKINVRGTNLTLQNSVFGFIIGGSIASSDKLNSNYCGFMCEADELNSSLRKFWEIEEIGNELPKNKENSICEEHYARTHRRDKSGKYTVSMPFKEHWSCLGNSRDIALKRLDSLWTRLSRDQEYLKLYSDFLKEYEELGHMTEIRESIEPELTYYMPHHGVYRPQKSTTKLRTVFNASTLTTSGNSLNSIQYNGGIIQEDLFTLLVRFRKHIFAFTADIRQMYRMINIDESQRPLQRILWKEGVNEPVKVYQLNTVTYGTVSAPFLAMRTLRQISIDEGENFPIAASVLCNDFYMDDVLSGASTLDAAKTLQCQLIDILKTAQMSLHKWCGNTTELIPTTKNVYEFSSTDEIKTLGIAWKAKTDCFTFKVEVEQNAHPTKRSVLSIIARLFDPLGLLGPVITKAKIFMQRLWSLKIDWNDRLPLKEAGEWQEFVRSLLLLNDINIERCIVISCAEVTELHGFCDASEKAFGAAIYARSVTPDGEVKVKLIASKSRVSPIKQVTIPRLELCSAVLLTKLMPKVQNALKMDIASVCYWTDSTIVLSWIKKESRDLKTFVGNRVAIIQEFTEMNMWHHIPSEQNPADIISRGLDPEKIQQSDLWWFGPDFLKERIVNFPRGWNDTQKSDLYQRELKNNEEDSVCFVVQDCEILPIINKCSSFLKLRRIIAWCVRFMENARNPLYKTTGNLTAAELSTALVCLVRNVQSVYFAKEIQCIEKGQQLSNYSNLLSLSPFLDDKNVLCVGGRLRHSNLLVGQKHQMLIPNDNHFCDLIINYYHVFYLHTGTEATLANIRTQFWIIRGRSTVKRIVKNCVNCLKVSAKGKNQMMADLPSARVNIARVFTKVGLDYCGPFSIKLMPGKVKKVYKCYICIFVCFVVRAIHLEIVTSLSTEAFIGALKRFTSRRGRPSDIFSDNGTNFVGANNEFRKILKELFKNESADKIEKFLASESIKWHFNPPATPHFGGLWEAGVKSLKGHLKRVAGNTILTHEEFFTLVTQVEAVLNSRPLCPLSEDPNDDLALTPAHFLVGSSLTSIPEPDFREIPMNRLSRWELVQKLLQTFWTKWKSDYLNHLQARPKWYKGEKEFKENDVVLVKGDDNLKLLNWNLAKIIKVHPGKDNIIRVVTLKTSKGIYKRPVHKIVKLPYSN